MKQFELLNNWAETGNDPVKLANLLAEIDSSTRAIRINPGEVNYLVLYTLMNGNNDEEILVGDLTDPLAQGLDSYDMADLKGSVMNGWTAEIIHEACKSRFFMSWQEQGKEVLSYGNPSLLCNLGFADISGEALKEISWAIVNAVAYLLKNKGVTLVVRKSDDDAVNKVVAIRSIQYMYVPQMQLLQLTNNICKDGVLVKYYIDNDETVITYSFPDLAIERELNGNLYNCTPKIRFSTSDAGKGSMIWKLGWDILGREIYLAPGKLEVLGRHRGEMSEKKEKGIKGSVAKLFSKTTDLADRIDALDKEQIFYGEAETVVRNLMEDNTEFKKLVKKEIRDTIVEQARDKFTDPVHTAAELVMFMQDVPDNITGLIPSTLYSIKMACGEMFYQKIRKDQGYKASATA